MIFSHFEVSTESLGGEELFRLFLLISKILYKFSDVSLMKNDLKRDFL